MKSGHVHRCVQGHAQANDRTVADVSASVPECFITQEAVVGNYQEILSEKNYL